MAKPPEKLYRIGEIMKHTGLSRQTLHNYTMLGLIRERERAESGHRLYGEEVFNDLEKIQLLKRHRTLTEIKEHLDQLRAGDKSKPKRKSSGDGGGAS